MRTGMLIALALAGLGCGGSSGIRRSAGGGEAAVTEADADRWRPPPEWAQARADAEPPLADDWRTPPPAAPPPEARVVRVDLTDAGALTEHGFVEQFGEASSAARPDHLRLEVQTHGSWVKEYGHYDEARWWWQLDHQRGWAVEARLRVARAADPDDPGCGAGLWVGDTRGVTHLAVTAAGVGVFHPHRELHPVPDVGAFHTYRFERARGSLRVLVDGAVLFETDADGLDRSGGGRRLGFGQLGGCRGGSITDWVYVQYETAPTFTPACPSCTEGEHPQLARFRRSFGITSVRTTGTAGASLGWMARAAFDETARVVVPEMLRQSGRPARAAYLEALPPLRTRADARTHYRHVTHALVGVEHGPVLPARSAAKRTPPSEPPPPQPWMGPVWSEAYNALERGDDAEALHQLRILLLAMVQAGYAATQEIDGVIRAML